MGLAASFIAALRENKITSHVASVQRVGKTGIPRCSAIDRRTAAHHRGYQASQRVRKRIEEVFGWIEAAAGLIMMTVEPRSPLRTNEMRCECTSFHSVPGVARSMDLSKGRRPYRYSLRYRTMPA